MSFQDWFGASAGEVPPDAPPTDVPHTLALYKYDACPYCRRVLSAVQRLGLEVEMRDTMRSATHRADLRSTTGRTTVPCLFIDGTPLFESRDIIAWLEAYAEAGHAG